METTERMDRPNFLSQTNTWLICGIFLVFASLYGFSFERGAMNSSFNGDAQAVAGTTENGPATLIKMQETLIYLLSAAFIFPCIRPVWKQVRSNALVFSLVGWAIVSVLWSDIPSTSAFNCLRMTINLVFVIYLFERYSPNDIQRLVMLAGCVAAAGSLFLIFALPQYGIQSRGDTRLGAWEGIFGHKNICGLEMLIMLLPAFFVKLKGSYAGVLRVGYIGVVLVIIAMTRSAGAWVVGTLCLVFIAILKVATRMRGKEVAAALIPLVAAGVILGIFVLSNFASFMYALGKDPTMTGRTTLWFGLIEIGMRHPIRGYGYTAFWQGVTKGPTRALAIQMGWPSLAGAENGVLEQWLELGFVGLFLYFALFLRAVRDAAYCMGRGASPEVLWYVSMLFYVVATNIEGGNLLTPSYLSCLLPFVAYVGLRREAKRLRARQNI
jgi:O-antigen ligase